MIIIKLWGGIGNQLFQYVFGQYLRFKNNQDVRYDDNAYYSVDKLRKRELDVIDSSIKYDKSCIFSKYRGLKNRILRYLYQMNPRNHYISEQDKLPSHLIKDRVYFFQGYWQNYIYYKWIIDNVPDFKIELESFPDELSLFRKTIVSETDSVSLHIRRGDYFLPHNIKVYGVCNSRYYQEAIDYIKRKLKSARFFVFTDDVQWVQKNICLDGNTVIIPNYNISQFAYIELMSLCHHHIISNSSFSWWGAVLNERRDSYVICPNRWTNTSNKTIALDKWIKIPVVNDEA